MKNIKKVCIIWMSLLASASAFGGVATMTYVSADGETIVVDGASVRMSDPTGIRFETLVEKQEGYTYGTLIIPKSLLGERELTVAVGADALNVTAEKWNSDNSGFTVVLGGANGENGITDFPELKYNETLVACSYMLKDGEYTYSAPIERTLAWVASMALADTSEANKITNTTQRAFLEGICDYVVGDDAFAFTKKETIAVSSVDLGAMYTSSNGSEGLAAIWSSNATDVATVNEKGLVSITGEGSATITAKIGTKTASVVVKSGAKIEGTLTGATDGVAKLDLYDVNGAYLATYDATVSGGAYTAVAESAIANDAAKAIVSQGANAAFIDDLATSKNGEMVSAKYRVGNATLNGKTIASTESTYALAKASANGEWAYTTAYANTYGLIMPGTATAENYAFTTQMTKPSKAQNEAGVGITNGEWVLSFQRKSGANETRYGTRINVHFEKLGTSTSYDFEIYCGYWNDSMHDTEYLGARNEYGNWNNERTDVCGDTASGVYGNAIWTIERTGDSVQLYAEPTKTTTGLERKLVLTVTAEGITLANSAWASDSYNRLFKKDYGAFEASSNETVVNGLSAFFGEGVEHAMAFVSDSRATTEHAVTYKTSVSVEKTITGSVTGAVDGAATVELYDANNALVKTYEVEIVDGVYSIVTDSVVYDKAAKAIVSQGANAAFIDDLATSKNGEMVSAKYRVGNATLNGKTIASTESTYALAKASANGEWAYTTAYANTYGLIMPGTATAENYAFTTQMTKPSKAQNEAGVGITNGEWVLSFQRATGTGGFPYGTRINVHFEKLGTSTSYDFVVNCGYWNGSMHDTEYLGGRSEYGNWNTERNDVGGDTKGVYGNAIWTIERTGDSVQLYAEPITSGLERKLVLTVTAEGITLANSAWASDSYNRLFKKDYGAFEASSNETVVNGLSAFFGEGVEHAMAFVSDSRATTEHAVTYKTSVSVEKTITGSVTGAVDGAATVELYDANNALVKTYEVEIVDGVYSIVTDSVVYDKAAKAIVLQDNQVAFLDTLDSVGEMANAISLTGTTYAQKKDSADGEWTFSAAAGASATQSFTNYAPTGDYAVEFNISGSGTRGTNGNAGIDIFTSVKGYIRLIFGTDCNNGNGMKLLISDGSTETSTGIILTDGDDVIDRFGRFNSSTMEVNVKVVRVNGVITISAKCSGYIDEYVEILRIDANGISGCDNGYTYLNGSSESLDLATYFAGKASAIAGYTTDVNTFALFHNSSNAYTYNCSMKEVELKKIVGDVTGATVGAAKVAFYTADGVFMKEYGATIVDGKYSVVVDDDVYANAAKAIVSQGANAAFIDDLATSKNGEMVSAKYRVGNATLNGKTIASTESTYALAKASANGEWAYTTAYANTYGLIMPGTATAENYAFTTQMTKPSKAQNEAGVGITNGEWVLSFQRKSGANETRYGTRINVHFEKLGTTTSFDFEIYCGRWNSNFTDTEYLGGRSEYGNWNNERNDVGGDTKGVYGNAIWTIERTGDSVQLYAEPITSGLERKLVLTVTAEGITLANSAWASDSYNRLFKKDYGAFEASSNATIVNGLSAFFGEGVEHAMAFVSDSRAATEHAVTYKVIE